MFRLWIFVLFGIIVSLLFPYRTYSLGIQTECPNRYLTLVNPVRGRNLWTDSDIKSLRNQYGLVEKYGFPATWLLQFDVFEDQELLKEIRTFNGNQERGVFLEVSEKLANNARVVYPHGVPWFSPRAVFLSGYSPSERRRLIDSLFHRFKEEFHYFPKSVGSWWIDSYSLDYMREKYGIKTALIVADQKTTDNYGVWGQWWSVPYFPSKVNILTPASSLDNKQDVVIIQWAQRHPTLSYGEGPRYSNYSLQANDYIRQGKDTNYFADLVNVYLDCRNQLGQVTVGLETGIESVPYLPEFEKQLEMLHRLSYLQPLSMSQFADKFSQVYPDFPKRVTIGYPEQEWDLSTSSRSNDTLRDVIRYNQVISFSDYFIADHANFLNRRLSDIGTKQNKLAWLPWSFFAWLLLGIFSFFRKSGKVWVVSGLFAISAFGLMLRSYYQYGWEIFYGPAFPGLIAVQVLLVSTSFGLIWGLSLWRNGLGQRGGLYLWILPLSFGFDQIASLLRASLISGKYYFGVAIDALRFVGISFSWPFQLGFVNQDFPAYQADALLKINFSRIWDNTFLSFVVYPLIHIFVSLVLYFLLRRIPRRMRMVILTVLIVLFGSYVISIFQADPRLVVPLG